MGGERKRCPTLSPFPQKKMQNKRPMIRYRKKEDEDEDDGEEEGKDKEEFEATADQGLLKLTMLIPSSSRLIRMSRQKINTK